MRSDALKDDRELCWRPSRSTGVRWNTPGRAEGRPRDRRLEAFKRAGVGRRAEGAKPALKDDREFMPEAVKQNWHALLHVSDALKDTARLCWRPLAYGMRRDASAALKDDRETVLEAVKQNGMCCHRLGRAEGRPRDRWRPSSRTGCAVSRLGRAERRPRVRTGGRQAGRPIRRAKKASAALKDDREIVLEVKLEGCAAIRLGRAAGRRGAEAACGRVRAGVGSGVFS